MAKVNLPPDEMTFLKNLGGKLRKMRAARGWTLEEVEQHGWSGWQHLQKIESGKNITVVTLRRVARLYKVSLSELLKDL